MAEPPVLDPYRTATPPADPLGALIVRCPRRGGSARERATTTAGSIALGIGALAADAAAMPVMAISLVGGTLGVGLYLALPSWTRRRGHVDVHARGLRQIGEDPWQAPWAAFEQVIATFTPDQTRAGDGDQTITATLAGRVEVAIGGGLMHAGDLLTRVEAATREPRRAHMQARMADGGAWHLGPHRLRADALELGDGERWPRSSIRVARRRRGQLFIRGQDHELEIAIGSVANADLVIELLTSEAAP